MSGTTGAHATRELITAYVVGDPTMPEDQVWALEAHLENCAGCRQLLAEATTARLPAVDTMLEAVWSTVDAAAVERPAPLRSKARRHLRTWAPPSVLPWLLMSVLVLAAAIMLDLVGARHMPSLVLLVAPMVPLAGVVAAWNRRLDPMGELTMATPRAGLRLVLRRTTAVLVVLIPALAAAGGITGASLALCLLPCLAFTLGTLALGSVIGVGRAALALSALWTVAVLLPSLFAAELPVLLAPASLPIWALAAFAAALVTVARARVFTTASAMEPR